MTTTPKAGFTLMPSNALKNEAIFNEFAILAEALIYGGVISRSLLDPATGSPAPSNGDAYIVPSGSPTATGDFSGQGDNVAIYFDGWHFVPPQEGLILRVVDENTNYRYQSGAWSIVTDLTDVDAIHDNVAGEIAAVTAKGSPTSSDFLLIEDAADSNNKKRITIGDLPGSAATLGALTDVDLTGSPSLVDGDILRYRGGTWYRETAIVMLGAVRLTKSANQSITTGANTDLTWDQEEFDTHGMHTGSAATVSVPEWASYARASAGVLFDTNGTGVRELRLQFSGGEDPGITVNAQSVTKHKLTTDSGLVRVNGGDTVKVFVFQNSGGNLNVETSTRTFFTVEFYA